MASSGAASRGAEGQNPFSRSGDVKTGQKRGLAKLTGRAQRLSRPLPSGPKMTRAGPAQGPAGKGLVAFGEKAQERTAGPRNPTPYLDGYFKTGRVPIPALDTFRAMGMANLMPGLHDDNATTGMGDNASQMASFFLRKTVTNDALYEEEKVVIRHLPLFIEIPTKKREFHGNRMHIKNISFLNLYMRQVAENNYMRKKQKGQHAGHDYHMIGGRAYSNPDTRDADGFLKQWQLIGTLLHLQGAATTRSGIYSALTIHGKAEYKRLWIACELAAVSGMFLYFILVRRTPDKEDHERALQWACFRDSNKMGNLTYSEDDWDRGYWRWEPLVLPHGNGPNRLLYNGPGWFGHYLRVGRVSGPPPIIPRDRLGYATDVDRAMYPRPSTLPAFHRSLKRLGSPGGQDMVLNLVTVSVRD